MTDETTDTSTNSDGEPVTGEAKPAKESTKKTAVPEGHLSPVDFAKKLSEVKGEEVRPQIVYGYLKNMKEFPQVDRGEGVVPRIVIPTDDALAFLNTKAEERATKKAEKEAKAAAEPVEATA